MRQLTMFNRVSADGYFTTPDGKLDWAGRDDEIEKMGASGSGGTDTILFGRRTYQMFAAFWPHAVSEAPTSQSPHAPHHQSAELKAMATMINSATKLVYSKTLTSVDWKNSQIRHELDPREIADLKTKPGKGMIIFGSGTIVSLLAKHGLIDEYQFVVSPVLLGGGRTLITGLPAHVRLTLLEAKPTAAGNVFLRYAPA